jgi:hypothetical protein
LRYIKQISATIFFVFFGNNAGHSVVDRIGQYHHSCTSILIPAQALVETCLPLDETDHELSQYPSMLSGQLFDVLIFFPALPRPYGDGLAVESKLFEIY